jgi:N-acetylglucosamine kinase-like BadF-type ATPase
VSGVRSVFLGVDGGGSKTAFVLVAGDGTVLASHEAGSAYYPETGLEAVRVMLHAGVAALLGQAGLAAAAVTSAFFGLPMHGEDDQTPLLDRLPEGLLPVGRHACGNDMLCGWAGSLGGEDGINIVAGTGSIGYGEIGARRARCGGWGELFSDEGSAYWIAREGLALFSRMSDGRAEKGPWYAILRAQLGSRADLELATWVMRELGGDRSRIAALARLVHEAAVEGDAQATAIFAAAGSELARIAIAIRRQLGVPDGLDVRVSYSGGVFASGDAVTAPFRGALAASGMRFTLVRPRFAPAIGAALYAARLAGRPLAADALARLPALPGTGG